MADMFAEGLFFFIAAAIMLLLPQTKEKKITSIIFAALLAICITGISFIFIDLFNVYPAIQFIFWKNWITSYENSLAITIAIAILILVAVTAAAFYTDKRKEIVVSGVLAMILWAIFALYPVIV